MTICTEFAILVTVGNDTLDKGTPIRPPVPDAKTDVIESKPSPPTAFAQLRGAGRTAARGVRAWSGRPVGRVVLTGLLIFALLGVAGVVSAFVAPDIPVIRGDGPPASVDPSQQTAAPPSGTDATVGQPTEPVVPVPSGSVNFSPTPGVVGRPADALVNWAAPMAGKVSIPTVALQAYGYAELVVSRSQVACHLSWTTLAGIGKIESDHGRAQGATLQPDGKALPAIIGAPLDGQSGRKSIPDTDAGQLDTDRSWDRAVGPMQFIPSTWQTYGVDADNDGIKDINDIDDASLAAAIYLCSSNRDLAKPADWQSAIAAYNAGNIYYNDVYNAANDYGRRSRS
jgi:hypothetical protein